jgi:hypothetical protein
MDEHKRQVAELNANIEIQKALKQHLQLQLEQHELKTQVAREERRKKGFAGHINIGGGFNAFRRNK